MSDVAADNKRPLLLFSGGLDSTYLLWSTLSEDKQAVDLIYINGNQGRHKTAAELKARGLIIDWLKENVPDCPPIYELSVRSKIDMSREQNTFKQALPWFVGAMEVVDPDTHTQVNIAYVSGDQISSMLDNLSYSWNYMWPVCKGSSLVPLNFPLRHFTKAIILDRIPKELYKLTWVCETPTADTHDLQTDTYTYVACNKCAACTTRKVESYRYTLDKGGKMLPRTIWGEQSPLGND